MAKKCNLVSVKNSNATNWSFSALIDGMDWALNDMVVNNRTGKSVVNVSGGGPTSTAVNNALLEAHRKGMTLVAAAGNGQSCLKLDFARRRQWCHCCRERRQGEKARCAL